MHCYDDSNVNIVVAITITITISIWTINLFYQAKIQILCPGIRMA